VEPAAPDRLPRATAVLLDLDGVVYVEDEPVAGAIEAVAALRDRGLRLRFVTNTTSRPRRDIRARLERLGMPVPEHELVTPARLAVEHCLAAGRRRALMLMRDDVKVDLAGLQEVREGAEIVVVGDLGEDFGYRVLNRAFRELLDGAELVALQKNRYWRTPDGLSLDVGPFVAALEYATGCDAVVVGKPAPAFFATVLTGLGVRPAEAVMVGDDVESDVGGALRAGLAGVLVRTGKYRPEAVAASGVEPTATVDSVADVPALLGA
jgi:phospholysine phosphohistidine inorganic pyrophosphate phosphatase